ncbi:MAG: InlB B-repeat-containing protein [Clostridia bacterium]|nr:InlB B-repeat-containing protein [Clostridia bacterium]
MKWHYGRFKGVEMKILKKTFRFFAVALLIAILAFSFTACKKDDKSGSGKGPETPSDQQPGEQKPGEQKPSTPPDEGKDPVDTTVQYTVTFANVEGDTYAPIKVNKNGTVTVKAPERSDAIFLGWYMDAGFTAPFTVGATKITADTTLYAKWKNKSSSGETVKYTVSFNSDGGSEVAQQSVEEGKCAFNPVAPVRGGYQFKGWYLNGAKYDFNNVITGNITLVATWEKLDAKVQAYGGYNESLYVEWSEGAPSQASVQYKLSDANTWINVDSELIRSVGSGVARVDAVGLKAGDYDVKIQPSGGASAIELNEISVTAYDRSGYAHFKYTDGVGAYNDDGTLKDNAIVIYVTEENKDYVMRDAVAKYPELNMFQIPTYPGTTGKDWGHKDADGIGWWLNNAQYMMSNNGSKKNKRPSNTYDAANGKNLAFMQVNDTHPIAIRFIGKVTVPEGCTASNNEDEGGLVGDGGYMARMKNMKNVTLEGIGDDAEIFGWGFHFLAGSDAVNGQGKSFEVRNLLFNKYVEDAVGMEGVQEGGKITGSVDRCWIHNNSFLPGDGTAGGTQSATESDKKEGDGSIDFKRGEYLTSSYNYFADCHKTGLIGSSDSSLQYNITMHHNWWHNCGSRTPLARQANIHFYNNYISTDCVDGKPDISYVHSVRANSYIFSESNYYFGCKAVTSESSTTSKSWNNAFVGCTGNNGFVIAKTRTEATSNNCTHFSGTSYKTFDTNPDLFYYDTVSGQSKCLMDTPVAARQKALQYAGRNGWGKNNPKKQSSSMARNDQMNLSTPTAAIPVPDEGTLTVDFSNPPAGLKLGGKLTKGEMKANGEQLAVFMLAEEAEVTFSSSTSGENAPSLIDSYGTPYAIQVSNETTVVLPAGIYIIFGRMDFEYKDCTLSTLSFKSTGNTQAKFDNLNEAINAIGTVTLSSQAAIDNAQTLLDALKVDEIAEFDAAYPGQRDKIAAAQSTYNDLKVQNVITLINNIGTVDDNSYPAIEAARTAYNALNATLQSRVTNYSTLTAAEDAWANRAVTAINNQISALADPSTVSSESDINALLANYNSVKSAYDKLTAEQQNSVTNYSKVTSGITQLNAALVPYSVRDMIAALPAKANVTLADASNVTAARTAYDNLTADQKTLVGDITKLTEAEEAIQALQEATTVAIFTKDDTSLAGDFTVSGKYNSNGTFEYNGETYNAPLKLESSTSVTFNTAGTQKLTLKIGTKGGQLKVDGTVYKDDDGDGFIVINNLAAGSHEITKASGDPNLCYAVLEAAS